MADSTDDFQAPDMCTVLIILFHIQELGTLMLKNPPDSSETTYNNYYELMHFVWRKGALPLTKYPYTSGIGQCLRFTSDAADAAVAALEQNH